MTKSYSHFFNNNHDESIDQAAVIIKLLYNDVRNGSIEVKRYIYSLIERANNSGERRGFGLPDQSRVQDTPVHISHQFATPSENNVQQ